MGSRVSAGLILYRVGPDGLEVLLAHPGGPFFVHKDAGHWTIPKGEVEEGADLLETAKREFGEEIGMNPPANAAYLPLGSIRQKGGKTVHAWATIGDFPEGFVVRSNSFTMEWPPGSGTMRQFPEVDRAEFFKLEEARRRIKPTQIPLLDELVRQLDA
jgi:predicted NUDIX family NTP pyrophosphohydrolase